MVELLTIMLAPLSYSSSIAAELNEKEKCGYVKCPVIMCPIQFYVRQFVFC